MRSNVVQRATVKHEDKARLLDCGHMSLLDFDTYADCYCVFYLDTGKTLCGKCSAKLVWRAEG